MIRAPGLALNSVLLAALCAGTGSAWVESVEFPWNTFPPHLCERELVWLKNIGIRHVSLPPLANSAGGDQARLREVIAIIRRLGIEADLERPVPDDLQPLTREHGGPLTGPLPAGTVRIGALESGTLNRERHALHAHAPAVLWRDVEDTIGPDGFRPGAVNFTGDEKPAAVPLRRAAQLAAFWGGEFANMKAIPEAAIELSANARVPAGISVVEFGSPNGPSAISVINDSNAAWTGTIKAIEHGGKALEISGVSVPAHESMMLPVHVPLVAGPLCKGCSGLAPSDYLVDATAELTAIEYENGIIAMEFSAPVAGEVILQLDHEPSGPLVAGGKPVPFDWDAHTMRARLPIPAGKDPGNHVRIGLAIDAPDHTAYFENARVLLIGETNHLTAQFSSNEIQERSRLHIDPELPVKQQPAPTATKAPPEPVNSPEPVRRVYDVTVPSTAVHGDHVELVLEADAIQMSHVRPQLLKPVTLRFPDAIQVRLSQGSSYPLYPATLPVKTREGRDLTVSIRNNAPEIRTFRLAVSADGLDFSPANMEVSVGASTSRQVSFRMFATGASPGIHAGSVTVSGATPSAGSGSEPFRAVVIPPASEVAWSANGFFFLENAAVRASFLPGCWLEYMQKERGQELLSEPIAPFSPGPISISGDGLLFAGGRMLKLADLERLALQKSRSQTQTRPRL